MRTINEIIIHCSATPEGRAHTVKDIDAWHKQRGFKCVGYHYVILLDGTVQSGRDPDDIGAHCVGHNAHSIGVCYIGGLAADCKTPKDTRTLQQKTALLHLLRRLRQKYPSAKIFGHCDFAVKACPSFDATAEYSTL